MIEVTLQLSPPLSKSVKEIANKQFEGSLTAVLNAALELYLDTHAQKRKQLKKVVQQIRQEVEARGGFDEKDLERRIRQYRRVKYSKNIKHFPFKRYLEAEIVRVSKFLSRLEKEFRRLEQ